jgi:hypothetical protein
MDRADRDLFERSLQHAAETLTGAALDAALFDLGWPDVLEVDPPTAVSILFELEGATLASSSALGTVLAGSLGLPAAAPTPTTTPGFVLPALGRGDPPGRFDGGRLVVAGLLQGSQREHADVVVVTTDTDTHTGADRLITAIVPAAQLTLRPVHGLDPSLELLEVSGDVPWPDRRSDLASPAWAAALARGRLAVAHELVGASRKMLELARQHALDRTQFGRAIGKFQAVRHRLAETLIAIESAVAVLDAGWEDESTTTAALAKALAGRGARTTARHCQQVLAGIGFTTEHDFHRYLRRVLVLDALLGGSRSLTKDLGTELLTTRELPSLILL